MQIEVEIMSGAGNIFSVIDNFEQKYSPDFFKRYAPLICSQSYSPKTTEGILVIEPSNSVFKDFSLKFFNPDGSFGMMCGNGGRCAVAFALEKGLVKTNKESIKFDVWGQEYSAETLGDEIKITFPPPKLIIQNKLVPVGNYNLLGDFIDVGSPHFILNFNSIPMSENYDFFSFPITELGRAIRFHNEFSPEGTNVDFFTIQNDRIFLRTYERGVEAETGACGTGAIATAVSVFIKNPNKKSLEIIPTSKEKIRVVISTNENQIYALNLIGGYRFLGKYKIFIDD